MDIPVSNHRPPPPPPRRARGATPPPPPAGLRITKLTYHPDGYWSARLTLNGQTVNVDNSARLWAIRPPRRASARDALGRGERVTALAPIGVIALLNRKIATATRRAQRGN
jgi:hypothetical protein